MSDAILFLNKEEGVWELITTDQSDPVRIWKVEAEALSDLAKDGWKIEGPFRMRPKKAGFPRVWFTGYGLIRSVH